MIIGYDPVAQEVEIDLVNGRPRLGFSTEFLVVKHYANGGILFVEFGPHAVELGILPEPGVRTVPRLVPAGTLRWRVEFSSAPEAGPRQSS
ncbi:hypothetical protein D3C72_940860 [compost metagenome]